ncbi:MAG: Jag N-terminal domain-containing protein [Deltaproteobacteria bacterium]|nr:Jag N-terminal domain-containing protein [Deltaproteobacteria bacterium]
MSTRQYEGRSAAEAAIKACEELGVPRSALKYNVISESGEGLDRRVVIAVEIDVSPVAPDSVVEEEPPPLRTERFERNDRDRGERSDRPPRTDGEGRRGRGRRGGRGRDRDRGEGGRGRDRDRDRGRPRREEPDDAIDQMLNLTTIPAEPPPERPEVQGEPTARAATGRKVLDEIIALLGMQLKPRLVEDGAEEIHYDLSGADASRVIGKGGEALLSLQFLLNRIVARTQDGPQHLVLDAANYRGRRRDALAELARKLAKRATEEKKVVRLSPMSAHDRRIVHLALADSQEVTTRSEGGGLYRSLLIIPQQ